MSAPVLCGNRSVLHERVGRAYPKQTCGACHTYARRNGGRPRPGYLIEADLDRKARRSSEQLSLAQAYIRAYYAAAGA